jgi:plastocyanin
VQRIHGPVAVAVALAIAALSPAGCAGGAVPAETPPASGDPAGAWITVSAEHIAFREREVSVPSNRPFTIVFENRDPSQHNIAILAGGAGGARQFEGAIFDGPGTRWYAVPALAPGTYRFVCEVHPTGMTGTLVAT